MLLYRQMFLIVSRFVVLVFLLLIVLIVTLCIVDCLVMFLIFISLPASKRRKARYYLVLVLVVYY